VELVAPGATGLTLAGAGAGHDLWREILAAVTALPLQRRAVPDAASVGARLLVGSAGGRVDGGGVDGGPPDVEALNPMVAVQEPDPALVAAYRPVREASDRAAAAVLDLAPGS
jgi:sugar (pentulose or hexulose) kinase